MGKISAPVAAVLAVVAVCCVATVSMMHRSTTAAQSTIGSAQPSDKPLPAFDLPPGYVASADLQNEYAALMSEIGTLQRSVRRIERRLSEEAMPPDLAGIPRSVVGLARNPENIVSANRAAVTLKDAVDTDTIFVSIASFRDDECAKTIRNMFDTAKNPARLFMGVIQQNDPSDKNMECIPDDFAQCTAAFCPRDNVRLRKVLSKDAKGPTFGRYVAMLMYGGEKYFMMIDSHNRFVREWDSRLITMYRSIPSKKAVLSHYPGSWISENQMLENAAVVTVMCNGHFLPNLGFIRMDGSVFERSATPRLQPFSAAGFLFADALLVHEVPFDPNLDFLFDGEEILYSARMWTHGWDLYAPSEAILFHYYIRSHAPRVWAEKGNNWWHEQQVSNQRVQMILRVPIENTTRLIVDPNEAANMKLPPHHRRRLFADMEKYGLGRERSIEDYWKFAMVDPVHRKAGHDYCNKARAMK